MLFVLLIVENVKNTPRGQKVGTVGAFADLLEPTIRFHWTDFHDILYWGLLLKSAEKIQFGLYSDRGALHEHLSTFMVLSRLILLE